MDLEIYLVLEFTAIIMYYYYQLFFNEGKPITPLSLILPQPHYDLTAFVHNRYQGFNSKSSLIAYTHFTVHCEITKYKCLPN